LIKRLFAIVLAMSIVSFIPSSFAGETYKSKGTVNRVDVKGGRTNLKMEAVPSLKWPTMTMDFDVADKQALEKIKPGQPVEFDFVEKTKNRYEIKKITPLK